MSGVAMLYHGNNFHPAHRGFAESIDADTISVVEFTPKSDSVYEQFKAKYSVGSFIEEIKSAYSIGEHEVIISEGSRPLYTALIHKMIYGSKVIYLCADHRLHEIWNNNIQIDSIYTLFKHMLGKYGKPAMRTVSQSGVDGVIAVSDFVKEYLQPIFQDQVPIRIAHPFIETDLFERLNRSDPTLNKKSAVTVGRNRKYKGVDNLVEAWPMVRNQHPNAELHIVGDGHPKSYEKNPGINVHGFVENIVDAYANAGLYVQPSRMDPFPVTVLESLRAGLPAIVTESTGNRSILSKIDEDLVTPGTPEGLSKAINWYFNLPNEQKFQLSGGAKVLGSHFGSQLRKQKFRQTYEQLISDISK